MKKHHNNTIGILLRFWKALQHAVPESEIFGKTHLKLSSKSLTFDAYAFTLQMKKQYNIPLYDIIHYYFQNFLQIMVV